MALSLLESPRLQAALLALCLIPSAVTVARFPDVPHLGLLHDDAIYWSTAKAIAQQHEYRIPSLPGEPWQTKYPPLFPAYLSLAWLANGDFPASLALGSWLAWAWFPLFVFTSWRFFRKTGVSAVAALALAVLVALLPHSQFAASILMADLMLGVLLLWSLDRLEPSPTLAGLLAGLAYLARTAALPLLVVAPLYLLRRRRGDAVRFLVASLPFVIAWHVWSAMHRSPGSDDVTLYYTNYLGYQLKAVPWNQMPEHLWINAGYLANSISLLLSIDAGDDLPFSLLRPVCAVAILAGIVRLARKGVAAPYAFFMALYAGLLMAWYFRPNPRFLIPVLPLLLAGTFQEAAHLAAMIRTSWRKTPVAAAFVALALAALGVQALRTARVQHSVLSANMLQEARKSRDRLMPAYFWARKHTPAESVFYAINDPAFYLYTGRHALRPSILEDSFTREPGGKITPSPQLKQFTHEHNVTHVLISTGDFEGNTRFEFDPGPHFAVAFQTVDAMILRVSP